MCHKGTFFPFSDRSKTGVWTDASGRVELRAMPAGVYEFFPVRTEAQEAAVVLGTSTDTPIHVGSNGGSVEVELNVGSQH